MPPLDGRYENHLAGIGNYLTAKVIQLRHQAQVEIDIGAANSHHVGDSALAPKPVGHRAIGKQGACHNKVNFRSINILRQLTVFASDFIRKQRPIHQHITIESRLNQPIIGIGVGAAQVAQWIIGPIECENGHIYLTISIDN